MEVEAVGDVKVNKPEDIKGDDGKWSFFFLSISHYMISINLLKFNKFKLF